MTDSNRINGGRDDRGRFCKGNPGGPGNPNVTRLAQWRGALEVVVEPERLRRVVERLIEAAEAGEPWAVKELLDRTLGKPTQPIAADPDGAARHVTMNLTFDERPLPGRAGGD